MPDDLEVMPGGLNVVVTRHPTRRRRWQGRSVPASHNGLGSFVCSFCGLSWEVSPGPPELDEPIGIPVCCQKAQDYWRDRNVSSTKGEA